MQSSSIDNLTIANNFRYERKFQVLKNVSVKELVAITKGNSAFFKEVFHERQINNIYLDTDEYKFYFDNVDGVADRQKARIRWYGDTLGELEKPKLEIKLKKGLVGDKWTFALDPFIFDNSFDARILKRVFSSSEMPKSIHEMVVGLQPTLVNSYSRRYFLSADQKFRITLDYNIKYRNINKNRNNFDQRPQQETTNVVELKYSLQDDRRAQAISKEFPFRLSKNSKYVNGVNNFMSFPE